MSEPVETADETVVSLTKAAAEEVANMRKNDPESGDKPLRVYVEQGGCSGQCSIQPETDRKCQYVYRSLLKGLERGQYERVEDA